MEQDLLKRIHKLRSDPWEFLKAVRTLDQVDRANPIKPFPTHRDYLKLFTRVWLKRRLILVPKSRRMSMSWTCIAMIVWECTFHMGRSWAMVSKKEDDSNELIKRAEFILDNLDPEIVPREIIPRYDVTYCNIKFPEINSHIMGFASGADQLRQFTFSGIFGDEMAFWDNAEEMYSASFPTIEGKNENEGGKFVGVSSPAPGFFEKMVFDRLEETDVEGMFEDDEDA